MNSWKKEKITITIEIKTITIMMKREITKREEWCPIPLLTTCWLMLSLSLRRKMASPGQLPSVYISDIMFYGVEYPFSQFGSFFLAMLSSSFFCTCSLSEQGKLKSPWLRASSAQEPLKYQCVINIIITLNPKYRIVPAARKKINFPS